MSNSEAAEPYTIIEPLGGPLAGDVSVPGDKSISHRAVLFSAMAAGTSHLTGVLDSEDVRASIRAVEALGAVVSLDRQADGTLTGTVTGWGAEGPSQPDAPIDCGNSGTTARLLMGIVAPWDIKVTITGDESLRSAPCAASWRLWRRWASISCPRRPRRCLSPSAAIAPCAPSTTRAPWPRPS